jgi:DNA gyrase subunit A
MNNKIIDVDILEESKQCFLDYAKEVLEDRAIPSAQDGLLRVHREILWTMNQILKMDNSSNYKKSASIVGSTLASSYFHGDASCYSAMCKLSLPFLMRYPLIDGKGSLGTQESNDMQAASRYTNARPSKIADLMFLDYQKNIVDVKPTYNNEYYEPIVLPSLFPNAICNGRQAIGVSMAHNSMPHNLIEVCNAIIAYIKNNKITIEELMTYIKGPDFPLGGTIINEKDIKEAFESGKSSTSLKIRGDYFIEDNKIIFTSIPYRTVRSHIREQINKNVEEIGKYISDFNDESSVGENRLVFTMIDKNLQEEALACLFKNTDLQTSCSYNMNFIVNGSPKLCSMIDLIQEYVSHQNSVLIRAAEFDREKAEKRVHILEGLLIALKDIDKVIELIRASKDKKEARLVLMQYLNIDEVQANSILDMKLSRLTKLDEEDLEKELKEKLAIIEECRKTIENNDYRNKKLISKIEKMRDKYGDARRTKLENVTIIKEKKTKKEIPSTPVKIAYSNGSVKIVKRANKNDVIIESSLNSNLAIFTNKGMCYKLPVIKINSSMQSIKSLIKMEEKEEILFVIDFEAKGVLLFVTKQGMVKKTNIEEYNTIRSGKSIKLKDNDLISTISLLDDNKKQYLQLETKEFLLTFSISDISPTGKIGMGVKGIRLHENDEVISSELIVKIDSKNLGKRNQVGRKKK